MSRSEGLRASWPARSSTVLLILVLSVPSRHTAVPVSLPEPHLAPLLYAPLPFSGLGVILILLLHAMLQVL